MCLPRYYFHIIDSQVQPDLGGVDCESSDAAHAHAVRLAVTREAAGSNGSGWTVNVSDANGKALFCVTPDGKRLPI